MNELDAIKEDREKYRVLWLRSRIETRRLWKWYRFSVVGNVFQTVILALVIMEG